MQLHKNALLARGASTHITPTKRSVAPLELTIIN